MYVCVFVRARTRVCVYLVYFTYESWNKSKPDLKEEDALSFFFLNNKILVAKFFSILFEFLLYPHHSASLICSESIKL